MLVERLTRPGRSARSLHCVSVHGPGSRPISMMRVGTFDDVFPQPATTAGRRCRPRSHRGQRRTVGLRFKCVHLLRPRRAGLVVLGPVGQPRPAGPGGQADPGLEQVPARRRDRRHLRHQAANQPGRRRIHPRRLLHQLQLLAVLPQRGAVHRSEPVRGRGSEERLLRLEVAARHDAVTAVLLLADGHRPNGPVLPLRPVRQGRTALRPGRGECSHPDLA